ncbi:MAG: acetylglutamate kinase [Spirochaetales bacterium]|nr:acetylglutamate kinase [Spirochaetales bacterium]
MDPAQRARILLEALPYIQRFHKKTVVIKYGGAAMDKADLRDRFAQDVVLLQYVGIRPIIVHGGGPQINQLLKSLNIQSHFVSGHRYTTPETMEVVEMILSGRVNKEIVAQITQAGGRAVGISGKDAGLVRARRHWLEEKKTDGSTEKIDLGLVGDVESVEPGVLEALDEKGFIPVIAPVALGDNGETLNINADTMAGALAGALPAEKLILLTDTPGILEDGQTITGLTPERVRSLIDRGIIQGGMLPKVQCCLRALDQGVRRAHIIDGRVPHALLLEIFTDQGVGTLIMQD